MTCCIFEKKGERRHSAGRFPFWFEINASLMWVFIKKTDILMLYGIFLNFHENIFHSDFYVIFFIEQLFFVRCFYRFHRAFISKSRL